MARPASRLHFLPVSLYLPFVGVGKAEEASAPWAWPSVWSCLAACVVVKPHVRLYVSAVGVGSGHLLFWKLL